MVTRAPRQRAQAVNAEAVYKQPPVPALLPSVRLCTWAEREVVKKQN
ncbi:unnamed protein product, partial [Staurois parvus]